MRKDAKTAKHGVHILVALTFIGPRPVGLDVLHGENGKLDNRLCNIRYGTKAENMADKVRDKTDNRGEKHPLSKLTVEQVRHIRSSIEATSLLAQRFGVSNKAIASIRRRQRWAWLDAV
jgi:hypothetical protein